MKKEKNQVFYVSAADRRHCYMGTVAFNGSFTCVSNAIYSFLTTEFDGCTRLPCWHLSSSSLALPAVNMGNFDWGRMIQSRNI